MASTSSAIERGYDVDEAAALPLFHELPLISRVGRPVKQESETVYFDTADLDLAARRIALTLRTGGADTGWRLELPPTTNGPGARTEPLGADSDHIPDALMQEVRACVRDKALVPVARLLTRRTVRRLSDAEGAVLGVFDDDRVHGDRLIEVPASLDWREWKIALATADATFRRKAKAVLADAGARPSHSSSRLERVLGDRFPAPWLATSTVTDGHGSTAEVLLDYMREQVRMLGVQDPLVRRDEPDAVHQMRVACRRLRSVLATYRAVLDTHAVKQLRDELQWLASALGQARDIEVIHERITDRLNAEPAELIAGPIGERIGQQLDADFHDARRSGLTALDSTRYFQLLNALDAFLAKPPVTKRGRKAASRILPRLIRSEGQQLQRLVRTATATPPGSPARDLALHEVRKRAKRLRYSAETAIAVRRKAAHRLVSAAQDVQTILGDHQDSVVARDLLLRLAAEAHLRAESTFSYGRLHALEQASAATTDDAFLQAWARFPKPTVTS